MLVSQQQGRATGRGGVIGHLGEELGARGRREDLIWQQLRMPDLHSHPTPWLSLDLHQLNSCHGSEETHKNIFPAAGCLITWLDVIIVGGRIGQLLWC